MDATSLEVGLSVACLLNRNRWVEFVESDKGSRRSALHGEPAALESPTFSNSEQDLDPLGME